MKRPTRKCLICHQYMKREKYILNRSCNPKFHHTDFRFYCRKCQIQTANVSGTQPWYRMVGHYLVAIGTINNPNGTIIYDRNRTTMKHIVSFGYKLPLTELRDIVEARVKTLLPFS